MATSPSRDDFLAANNEFCSRLWRQVISIKSTDNDVAIAPFSVFVSLMIALNGTGHGSITMNEIVNIMGLGRMASLDEVNEQTKQMMKKLSAVTSYPSANSIFVNGNNRLLINPNFSAVVQRCFGIDSQATTFNSVKEVNDWCSQLTGEKVNTVLQDDAINLSVIIVNAYYFKGEWEQAFFKPSDTQIEQFLESDNITMSTCHMMKLDTASIESGKSNNISYVETENYQAIQLPFKQSKAASPAAPVDSPFKHTTSHVVTPPEGGNSTVGLTTGIDAVIILPKSSSFYGLDVPSIITDLFKKHQNVNGVLRLPRFNIEQTLSMKNALNALGVKSLFDSTTADLSKVVTSVPFQGFKVDDVIHKVVVGVDEETNKQDSTDIPSSRNENKGNKAFGFTTPSPTINKNVFGPSPPPTANKNNVFGPSPSTPPLATSRRFDMRCNKSFIFVLCERQTGLILFIGKVCKPISTTATINDNEKTNSDSAIVKQRAIPKKLLSRFEDVTTCFSEELLDAILNEDGVPLLKSASYDVQALESVESKSGSSSVEEIANKLTEAYDIFRFVNDGWLQVKGEPSASCYYNLACVLSLLVELQIRHVIVIRSKLLVQNEQPTATNLRDLARPIAGIKMGDLQSFCSTTSSSGGGGGNIAPNIPPMKPDSHHSNTKGELGEEEVSKWDESTLGTFLEKRLRAGEKCLKVAIAAGLNDTETLNTDRDLKALRDIVGGSR